MNDSLHHVERQILLTAMARPSALSEMKVSAKHFLSEQHADLWAVIASLAKAGAPCDPVSVMEQAERNGDRAVAALAIEIGGDGSLYASSSPAYPAGLLLSAWRDREAIRIADALRDGARTRREGAVDAAIASLMSLHQTGTESEYSARDALTAAWGQITEAHENGGRLVGVPTGLAKLDETLGGLHKSDLIIVGARPAMGKTGLLLGMVMAGSELGPVGLVSGEQPHEQVGLRWLASGSHISVGRLRAARIDEHEWSHLSNTVTTYRDRPIRIFDRSSPDIADVVRQARAWAHKYQIKALYVDYLQKLRISGMDRAPKHERIGEIARSLKDLARELQIPVIALAQVSRAVEQRADQRPMMSDLADSSEIEKEADQIMMLWRDLQDPGAKVSAAEINVVKNRHGNIGKVDCLWIGSRTSFVDKANDYEFSGAHV